MKTYFLFFDGDPNPHLEDLRRMGPILVVPIYESLHCISFGPNHREPYILNALKSHARIVYLVQARCPVFPEPSKKVQVEIERMIAEAEKDSEAFGHP